MSKFKPTELMAGMAAGVNFLAEFRNMVLANGGDPLIIYWLSMSSFVQKLDAIARAAIAQFPPTCPIPFSSIQRTMREEARKYLDKGPGYKYCFEHYVTYSWSDVVPMLVRGFEQVPVTHFHKDNPIPPEVRKQIEGKPVQSPIKITYLGEPYLVGYLSTADARVFQEGDVLEPGSLEWVKIIPARLINLES